MRESRRVPRSCPLRVEALEARSLLAPARVHPDLDVRTVVTGLSQPTGSGFLGENDFLVTKKATGRVRRAGGAARRDREEWADRGGRGHG